MELNEQTLEQILTRQREQYQRHAELQREEYQRHAELQREEFQRHVDAVRHDFKADLQAGLAETRHHMGILAEGLRSDIKAIAEGHDILRQEIGGLREQLTDLQERVTRIEVHVAKNTQDIVAIRVDIETIKSDIVMIRHDLKDKGEREEFMILESRVAELERTVRSK